MPKESDVREAISDTKVRLCRLIVPEESKNQASSGPVTLSDVNDELQKWRKYFEEFYYSNIHLVVKLECNDSHYVLYM